MSTSNDATEKVTSSENTARVAIIGAGIGGLTTAYTLKRAGVACDLFEASETAGGAIHSHVEDNWVCELGPNTLLDRQGVISDLIEELGLQSERVYPSSTSKNRFIVRDGQPHALPMSPAALWKTKLFSTQAKLRLFAEPFVEARIEPELDESLYNFATRRLGQEIVDYALDPFIAGTYAGRLNQLSSHYALARLKELEEESGSLFKGALFGPKKTDDSKPKRKASLINFKRGAQTLTDAMAREIGEHLHTSTPITKLTQEKESGRWKLTSKGDTALSGEYDVVLMSLPAHVIAQMDIRPADTHAATDLSAFASITHPPISLISIGFRRDQFKHPLNGFGVLIPSKEEFTHLGSLFASSIFVERAPRDHVQIVSFIGGARHPESALWSEEEQVALLLDELHTLLGLEGKPVKVLRRHWGKSIPQYEVGYEHTLSAIEAVEETLPGIIFGGNWKGGIAVPDVVKNARHFAHLIQQRVHQ